MFPFARSVSPCFSGWSSGIADSWRRSARRDQLYPLGYPDGINSSYHYADYLAPDGHYVYSQSPYSLADFFDFTQTPRTFVPITGATYQDSCFTINLNPLQQPCFTTFPQDPDDDAIEAQ